MWKTSWLQISGPNYSWAVPTENCDESIIIAQQMIRHDMHPQSYMHAPRLKIKVTLAAESVNLFSNLTSLGHSQEAPKPCIALPTSIHLLKRGNTKYNHIFIRVFTIKLNKMLIYELIPRFVFSTFWIWGLFHKELRLVFTLISSQDEYSRPNLGLI